MEMWSGWNNRERGGGQKAGIGEGSECSVKNNTH